VSGFRFRNFIAVRACPCLPFPISAFAYLCPSGSSLSSVARETGRVARGSFFSIGVFPLTRYNSFGFYSFSFGRPFAGSHSFFSCAGSFWFVGIAAFQSGLSSHAGVLFFGEC